MDNKTRALLIYSLSEQNKPIKLNKCIILTYINEIEKGKKKGTTRISILPEEKKTDGKKGSYPAIKYSLIYDLISFKLYKNCEFTTYIANSYYPKHESVKNFHEWIEEFCDKYIEDKNIFDNDKNAETYLLKKSTKNTILKSFGEGLEDESNCKELLDTILELEQEVKSDLSQERKDFLNKTIENLYKYLESSDFEYYNLVKGNNLNSVFNAVTMIRNYKLIIQSITLQENITTNTPADNEAIGEYRNQDSKELHTSQEKDDNEEEHKVRNGLEKLNYNVNTVKNIYFRKYKKSMLAIYFLVVINIFFLIIILITYGTY